MAIVKKCAHGRGKSPRARAHAWRSCGCSWYGDLRVDGARRYVRLGPDRERARVEYAQLIADREAGRLRIIVQTSKGETMRGLCDVWLASVEAENPPPRRATILAYRSRVKVIQAWFGDVSVAGVTPARVDEFLTAVEGTYSANYARDVRTTTGHVFAYAERHGLIGKAPMPVGRRKRRNGAPPAERMTIGEAERVIAKLTGVCKPMAEVALLTGLRRGELLGLRVRDVDLKGRRLRLVEQVTGNGRGPLKTQTSNRIVALTPRTVELLKPLVTDREPSGPVFAVSHFWTGEAMRNALKASGLYVKGRGWGWHSLRHANAALREMAGESIRSAAASLGHGAEFARTMSYGWSAESSTAAPLDAAREALSDRSSA